MTSFLLFSFARNQGVAHAAGPRPTSPREGAIAVSPAELRRVGFCHKAPKTQAAAPSRGRARPYDVPPLVNLVTQLPTEGIFS